MSDFKKPAISNVGVDHEKECALRDVQAHTWERGQQVIIKPMGNAESRIVRDDYNSLKYRSPTSSSTLTIYAYPINYEPSKHEIDKVGLREDTEVMIYTSMQDWIESDFDFDDIDLTRSVVIVNDVTYFIRDKKKHDMFYDDYLYIVLGLKSE